MFDIFSTVRKAQPGHLPNATSPSNHQPYSTNPLDEEEDKENIPVSYSTPFPSTSIQHLDVFEPMDSKRRATEAYRNVMADVDMDEDTSMTNQDSQHIRQLLSSQSQTQSQSQQPGRRSSSSTSNRISDFDENQTFMTGRRDTADIELLNELQNFVQ